MGSKERSDVEYERPRIVDVTVREKTTRERLITKSRFDFPYRERVGTLYVTDGGKDRATMSYSSIRKELSLNPVRIPEVQYIDSLGNAWSASIEKDHTTMSSVTKEEAPSDPSRPVIFCWNGGPLASGQQNEVDITGITTIKRDEKGKFKEFSENRHTPFQYADLVHIDPVGTGFGRVLPGEDPHRYYGRENDAAVSVAFIEWYLKEHNLESNPIILVGSSYAAFRVTDVALELQKRERPISALALISPFFDNKTKAVPRKNEERPLTPLHFAAFLPQMAVISQDLNLLPNEQRNSIPAYKLFLEAKEFAFNDYMKALPFIDAFTKEEREYYINKLSEYTGLPPELIDKLNLQITKEAYAQFLLKTTNRFISTIDSRFMFNNQDEMIIDPIIDNMTKDYKPTITGHWRKLGFPEEEIKDYINIVVAHPDWDYGESESVEEAMLEVLNNQPPFPIIQFLGRRDFNTVFDHGVNFWEKIKQRKTDLPLNLTASLEYMTMIMPGVTNYITEGGHSPGIDPSIQEGVAREISQLAKLISREKYHQLEGTGFDVWGNRNEKS